MTRRTRCSAALAAALLVPLHGYAQGRGAAGAQAARQAPREAAPINLTGYWVSVITEDWRYRMVTPTKGDFQGVPMTPAAVSVANAWKPEADEAAGHACKSYGAPASLRLPGRIHITWQDDETLRVNLDNGTQTRLLHFTPAKGAKGAPSVQGDSTARWETPPTRGGGGGGVLPQNAMGGWLKVTTSNMTAGYLRKNGVPYSDAAALTEYFNLGALPGGGQVLMVTSVVEDSTYLTQPFVVSSQFKKQADASGWDPTPCSSTW